MNAVHAMNAKSAVRAMNAKNAVRAVRREVVVRKFHTIGVIRRTKFYTLINTNSAELATLVSLRKDKLDKLDKVGSSNSTAISSRLFSSSSSFSSSLPSSSAFQSPNFDPQRTTAKTSVVWTNQLNFLGTDNDGRKVQISGGKGDGVSPMQMLLMALGSCASVDVLTILEKQKQEVKGLQVKVEGQRSNTPPKPYETIHMIFIVKGKNVEKKKVEQAVLLSTEKYCGVHATLSKAANITLEVQIDDKLD